MTKQQKTGIVIASGVAAGMLMAVNATALSIGPRMLLAVIVAAMVGAVVAFSCPFNVVAQVLTMPRRLCIVLAMLVIGCSRPQGVSVTTPAIPFTKQLEMKEGDAYVFNLPDGKTVAVWCERPTFGGNAVKFGEQTTKSGLKTAWGEQAFHRPELLARQIGPNTSVSDKWHSYIVQGLQVTKRASTSCLSATCALPLPRI